MIFAPQPLAARAKPPQGSRLARPVAGGFWLPGANGNVSDAAGYNPPAIISGTVTRVNGPFGGPALKLDGSSGFVTCPLTGNNALNWSTGNSGQPIPRCVWAWVRRPSSSSAGPILFKGNNSPNSGFGLSVLTTGLRLSFIGSSNGNWDLSTVLSVGDWHHVLAYWNGVAGSNTSGFDQRGNIAVYLDGQWLGSPPTTGASWLGNQNGADVFDMLVGKSAYVGGQGAPSAFADLEIDHWGLDHRVYSNDEIADLYHRPFRGFMPASFPKAGSLGGGAVALPVVFACT